MYPHTFADFYAAHPGYVRALIHKHRWADYEGADDLEQHLLTELLAKQVVERFDPTRYDGEVTTGLFLAFVKTALTNIYLSSIKSERSDKRSVNDTAISLSAPLDGADGVSTIADTLDDDGNAVRALMASHQLAEFVAFAQNASPQLAPLLDAMQHTGTVNRRELAEAAGLSFSTVTGRMQRLATLAKRWSHAD